MRRPLTTALLVVSILVTGACGGGDDKPRSPVQVLASAPAETVSAKTAKVALNVVVDGSVETAFKGDGVFDFKSQRGRLVMDLSSLGLPGGGGSTEILFSANVVFMKLPFKLPELRGRPWVKIDLSKLDELTGIDVTQLRQIQSNDPTAALNYLRGVTDKIEQVGREDVRGERTTHYKAVIDLNKASREAAPELKDDIAQVQKQLGSDTIDSDVWIDGEGRLRKLQYAVDLSKVQIPVKEGEAKPTGSLTATFELFDFGTKVALADPPADQVADLQELIKNSRAKK